MTAVLIKALSYRLGVTAIAAAIVSVTFYLSLRVVSYYHDIARVQSLVATLTVQQGATRADVESSLSRADLKWDSNSTFNDRIGKRSVVELSGIDREAVAWVLRAQLPDAIGVFSTERTSMYFFFDRDDRLLGTFLAKRTIGL